MTTSRLLTIKEVSKILNINTEVLRRWLRSKKLPGIKVGSDWRVNEKDLEPLLTPVSQQTVENDAANQPKMCFRFPKWLEYSGLPMLLNEKHGPECWPVFKKIIELDFEQGKPADREIHVSADELAERVGYRSDVVIKMLNSLATAGYLKLTRKSGKSLGITVITPLKTPILVFDISFEQGGIKGAPGKALQNNCLRRFLETDEKDL
ncbi:MAG: helix-turn-helix domain-containing protein [Candidatus Rifleibacteriota bacterium]